MQNLPGYQIVEQIHESHKSRVYKGYRDQDHQPVILKLLKQDYPTPKDLSRYQQEFEILHNLNIDSVVKAHALESYQNTLVIVLEDFGGISLSDYLQTQHFTLEQFLPLAIKITEAIGEIHAAQVIHKDINPSNIVWNQTTNQIKIIDFGISSRITETNNGSKSIPTTLEGTMIYMSPEQTGRMNRTVDYRTDFYSLGITFYEMLTGQLPFPINDLNDHIELVHCHIAKQPVPPHKINPDIPKIVSNIILKLLEKTPEARYQSAWGLREDLARCLHELERYGAIAEFPLGTQDISEQFNLPDKLYGRESEIQTLIHAFDRVVQGEKSLVILSGETGIGKSSLVKEIYQPVTQKQGYLLTGKFSSDQPDPANSAISSREYLQGIPQAFAGLIRQLLTESETQLNHWQTKLREALGDQLQIIMEIIPELNLMLNQPENSPTEPNQLTKSADAEPELRSSLSETEMNQIWLNLIRVFCDQEHPLVIFLDEIHWAEPGILKLLEQLMLAPDINHLLLILAYREYETTETREMPLEGFHEYLEILRQAQIKIEYLRLHPLTYEQITNLLAETLRQNDEEVKSLAGIVFWKTGGVPCLVRQFLKTLYQKKLLTFQYPQKGKIQKPHWTWDMEQVKALEIPNPNLELPVYQLKKLPESTQQLLHLAACLGATFNLHTLSRIYEKNIQETFEILWPGIQEGFILPQSELETIELESHETVLLFEEFKFCSHRFQKAAGEMITNEQVQKELNLKLGKFLQAEKLIVSEENLLKIIDNLNKVKDLIVEPNAQIELAELNLKAAKISQKQNNYDLARAYLTNAKFFLSSERTWENHYDLAIALCKMLAQVELATTQFEQAEDYLYLLIEKLNSPISKAEIAYQIIQHYWQVSKYKQALVLGKKALKWLGIDIPSTEEDICQQLQVEIERVNKYLSKSNQSIDHLISHEAPINLAKQILIKLLTALSLAAKHISQNLFDLLIVLSVSLSAQYGHLPESAYAYAAYSVILATRSEDDKSSRDFGELAFSLSKKLQDPIYQCLTYNLYANEIIIWFKPISSANSINTQGYEIARQAGNLGLARDFLMNQCINYFYQGKFLAHLMADLNHCLDLPSDSSRWTTESILASEIAIANLAGQTTDRFTFATKKYSENEYLNSENSHQDLAGFCLYKLYKMQILYLYEDYQQALKLAQEIEHLINYLRGSIAQFEYIFYYSMILFSLYKKVPDQQKIKFLTKLNYHQKKLNKWEQKCPENFRAHLLLFKAEIARINGNIVEAMNSYDYAIQLVQGHEYIQIRALADELAAKFWLEQKKEAFAKLYLEKARACYQIWGAKRKVEELESKYAPFLPMNPEEKAKVIDQIKPSSTLSSPLVSSLARTTTYMSSNREVAILDLATVMKASQAISQEIVLDKLLEKLMKILLENAGAQKGALILNNQGKLLIEAEGCLVTDPVQESGIPELVIQVLQSISIEESEAESPKLPSSIINYVARTRENVVLHDATQLNKEYSSEEDDTQLDLYRQFSNDPYLQKNQPRSILCAPLMIKGELYGIIYMENNLTPGAFTPARLEMLNLLSSQAAISIENSRYYAEMAALNKAYERFVPRQFLHFLKKKSIVDVQLGDNVQQEMSVLFSDIRSFTTLSESLTPAENFKFINSYLSSMEPAIVENNGFIDKYIGDAIMALFPGGADDSVEAAISMLRRLSEYNQGRRRAGYVPIEIGIGINTGDLMLGTVGGNSRMDSTVISDAVNLASRLEGLTKIYGVSLLISHQTFLRLSNATNYNIRIIERLKVKGKSHEVAVFEVFDGDEPELREQKLMTSSLFEEALMLYYRKAYQEAEKLFQDCLRQSPKDRVIRVYLERCQSNL